MNNKGFAVTGIIYSVLLIFLVMMTTMLFNLQNRKTILDELKLDAVDAVESENNYDYLLSEINALKSQLTTRYNSETDMIEFLVNGVWSEYKKAYMQVTSLYNAGVINTELAGDFDIVGVNGTSGSTNFNASSISVEAVGTANTARRQGIYTVNKIDLTDISKINCDFAMSDTGSNYSVNIGITSSIVSDPTSISNKVSVQSGTTLELDVSAFSGEYYVYVFVTSKSTLNVTINSIYMV